MKKENQIVAHDTKIKLWHFYHAYAQEGKEEIWLPIINEHIDALKSSGLAPNLIKTYIGVVGSEISATKISSVFSANEIENEICALNDCGWEQVTLNKLYEFSLGNDGYVFYAHTKGAFYPNRVRDLHRRTMNEYLINRWSEHIRLLLDGFSSTGIFFLRGSPEPLANSDNQATHTENHPNIKRYRGFFAGNFWWCKLSLIKNMGQPSMENRIKAEAWMNNLYDSIGSVEYMIYDMLPGKLYDIFSECLLLSKENRCWSCPTRDGN